MLTTKGMVSVFGLATLAVAVVTLTVFAVRVAQPGPATAATGRVCSVEDIAGSWLFATDVGQSVGFESDITALGTMNIDREGKLIGDFDVTVAGEFFAEDIPYWGSVTVNSDCTGTVTFITGLEPPAGEPPTGRTDSIAVLSNNEMWGMSQDPENLWTYDIRRIPGTSRQ